MDGQGPECNLHVSYYSAEFIFPDLSPTFKEKINRLPWLIYSREIPMSIFNRLQSHQKQGQHNKFKSGGTNNLRAKQAERILNRCTQTTFQNVHLCQFLHPVTYFYIPSFSEFSLTVGTMVYAIVRKVV